MSNDARDFDVSASQGLDASQVQSELDRLRQREQEMMALLGTSSPDRLMHDLRNILNEVQLLRVLAEDKM